ncbi:hypothetical protein BC628DRAFT_1392049 [Trametes gibbosa]|nr:hypothetical protein BC628DRAFT_1392049 [Trametes gibbosa]
MRPESCSDPHILLLSCQPAIPTFTRCSSLASPGMAEIMSALVASCSPSTTRALPRKTSRPPPASSSGRLSIRPLILSLYRSRSFALSGQTQWDRMRLSSADNARAIWRDFWRRLRASHDACSSNGVRRTLAVCPLRLGSDQVPVVLTNHLYFWSEMRSIAMVLQSTERAAPSKERTPHMIHLCASPPSKLVNFCASARVLRCPQATAPRRNPSRC